MVEISAVDTLSRKPRFQRTERRQWRELQPQSLKEMTVSLPEYNQNDNKATLKEVKIGEEIVIRILSKLI